MEQVVMAFSGGLDSTTILAMYRNAGITVYPVFFKYGSKHMKYELKAAQEIASYYNTPTLQHVDLTAINQHFTSDLLQQGGEIPEGHYNDPAMKRTVVPARNTLFIGTLMGIAQTMNVGNIAIGVHAGDAEIYPDCRPEYIYSMQEVVRTATEEKVTLHAPLLHLVKPEFLKQGLSFNTPYFLTRTCYKDQPIACGKCGSCQERLEAWEKISQPDPIEYEVIS